MCLLYTHVHISIISYVFLHLFIDLLSSMYVSDNLLVSDTPYSYPTNCSHIQQTLLRSGTTSACIAATKQRHARLPTTRSWRRCHGYVNIFVRYV